MVKNNIRGHSVYFNGCHIKVNNNIPIKDYADILKDWQYLRVMAQ
jgi:hypothetical protein